MAGVMVVSTKQVLTASAPPEECVKRAQVLVVGDHSWHVIAPAPYRLHCLSDFAPVPTVNCPVVDVRGVEDDAGMGDVILTCTTPVAGVINLGGLISGLTALGGKVQMPEARKKVISKQVAGGGRRAPARRARKVRVQ